MAELASNEEWKAWGEKDPLFAVATWDGRNCDGPNPWTDEEFYQMGESDWNDFRTRWERYGLDDESCVEIGCGAGRLTAQLETRFRHVHAVDVSEKMIEYAKRHIESPAVNFYVTNGTELPLSDHSVSAVFSAHVFQHFDSLSVASDYFAEIARVLKTGGSLMIHLPIYQWPAMPRAFDRIYGARMRAADVKAHLKRWLMKYGIAKPIMKGLRYPVSFFYDVLPEIGFDDVEVSVFTTKSNQAPHSFVMARKVS